MAGGSPAHPLVAQLRFARREFGRGLEGVSEAAPAAARLTPRTGSEWAESPSIGTGFEDVGQRPQTGERKS